MQIIKGKVIRGLKKGTILGFPTANLRLNKNLQRGIYISQTKVGENLYPSLTYIGKMAETFILDFKEDLYGRWISVKLLKKVRPDKKFKSEKELILQIKKDELVARQFLNMLV